MEIDDFVTVNTSVTGISAPIDLSGLIDPKGRRGEPRPTERRAVVFDGTAIDTPVYWRDALPVDVVLDGPAVIEQLDTTILLPPGDRAEGGADGNLILHIGAADPS